MSKKFSSGKRAVAICDRSGMKYLYKEMVVEPGTGYFVHRSESDGPWNLVDHPQNKPLKIADEGQALKNARPDVPFGED